LTRWTLWALVLWVVGVGPAWANDLEKVKAVGVLTWAADQEGGGPYILPREDDPSKVTGFEVELAAALAREMKVKDLFYQGGWDQLLDLLGTQNVEIVLNGYEWTPERAEAYEASIPYYVYALQLLARKDDDTITKWADLKRPGVRVGVLGGSGAETLANEVCAGVCEVVAYEGNTEAMRDTETGRLDANIQDTPIAAFYGKEFPALRFVDEPRSPGFYSIYLRKGETELLQEVNLALLRLIRSGELERIYKKWGIWDPLQEGLIRFSDDAKFFGYPSGEVVRATDAEQAPAAEEPTERARGWEIVTRYLPTLLGAAAMTVVLSFVSFPLAILMGIGIAVGRMYGPGWLRGPLTAWVELLRGTPLMLQLYFIFFVLPEVGIMVPAFATAIIGLAVNYSAYESEIYRAGLQAIPIGQMEASLSLGMGRWQAIRKVILPQAVRIVIPPVVNDFIALFKDTSVCSVITIVELTKQFSILSKSTLAIVEMMGMTALLYLAMSYPLSLAARAVERKLDGVKA
jgi:polar amino acid transport system substrate-binding protein